MKIRFNKIWGAIKSFLFMTCLVVAIAILIIIGGCSTEPSIPDVSCTQNSSRFEISRVSIVKDDIAYGGKRGIYIIKDKKTNTEYVGISGIGISEVGNHIAGKISKNDER